MEIYKIQRRWERWSFENDNIFRGLAAQITHRLFLFKPCNAVCIVVCSFCTIPLPLPQRLTHYDGLADVSDGEVQHLLLRPLASPSPPRHCCRRPCHHCRDSTLFFDIGSGRIFNHRFVQSLTVIQYVNLSILSLISVIMDVSLTLKLSHILKHFHSREYCWQFIFDFAFQMLAAISLHLDEISRTGLVHSASGGANVVEGGVGRMKHLRGKRKRLQQFLDQSVRRERREEEEEERDNSWSRRVKKIGALFSWQTEVAKPRTIIPRVGWRKSLSIICQNNAMHMFFEVFQFFFA